MNTCLNCEKRHVGCHSECEAYLQASAANTAEREAMRVEKMKQRGYTEYKFSIMTRMLKREANRHNGKRRSHP